MRLSESVFDSEESDEHDDERLTVALSALDDAIIDVIRGRARASVGWRDGLK